MEIIKTEGIIIGETNYSESSKILKVYTKDYGIISIMSKGCRNLKNKLRGVSNKLVYATFQLYYKENGISTLVSADVINTLRNILTDIEKISYVSYILDLAEQVYNHSKDAEIFKILIDTIIKINEGFNCDVLTSIIELKLLKYLGIMPNVDECSVCGNKHDIITISVEDGGNICQKCYLGGKIYSSYVIKLIRLFIYIEINKITKLDIDSNNIKEVEMFIDEYYDKYAGLYLKSKSFLKNLNKLSV